MEPSGDLGGQTIIFLGPVSAGTAAAQLDPGRLALRSDEAGPVLAVRVGRLGSDADVEPGQQRGVGW